MTLRENEQSGLRTGIPLSIGPRCDRLGNTPDTNQSGGVPLSPNDDLVPYNEKDDRRTKGD
jgi:hypothetical protein